MPTLPRARQGHGLERNSGSPRTTWYGRHLARLGHGVAAPRPARALASADSRRERTTGGYCSYGDCIHCSNGPTRLPAVARLHCDLTHHPRHREGVEALEGCWGREGGREREKSATPTATAGSSRDRAHGKRLFHQEERPRSWPTGPFGFDDPGNLVGQARSTLRTSRRAARPWTAKHSARARSKADACPSSPKLFSPPAPSPAAAQGSDPSRGVCSGGNPGHHHARGAPLAHLVITNPCTPSRDLQLNASSCGYGWGLELDRTVGCGFASDDPPTATARKYWTVPSRAAGIPTVGRPCWAVVRSRGVRAHSTSARPQACTYTNPLPLRRPLFSLVLHACRRRFDSPRLSPSSSSSPPAGARWSSRCRQPRAVRDPGEGATVVTLGRRAPRVGRREERHPPSPVRGLVSLTALARPDGLIDSTNPSRPSGARAYSSCAGLFASTI